METSLGANVTSEQVLAMTRLTEVQRKVLDLACRGRTDRQISQTLSISTSYIGTSLTAVKKKLGIKAEGHRALVHWYWTAGPGFSETRAAAVADALRDLVKEAHQITSYHAKLAQEGKFL